MTKRRRRAERSSKLSRRENGLLVSEERSGLERRRWVTTAADDMTPEDRLTAREWYRRMWGGGVEAPTPGIVTPLGVTGREGRRRVRMSATGVTVEAEASRGRGGFEQQVGSLLQRQARGVLEALRLVEPAPQIGPPAPYRHVGRDGWSRGPGERAAWYAAFSPGGRRKYYTAEERQEHEAVLEAGRAEEYPFGSVALPQLCGEALELLERVRYHLELSHKVAEAGGDVWSRRFALEGLAVLAFSLGELWGRLTFSEEWEAHAIRGERVQAGGRKGASAANAERGPGRRSQLPEWLEWAKHNIPHSVSHNRAAKLVGRHFHLPAETVRKMLPKKPW